MFCFSKPHLLITSGSCTCFWASSHFKFLCLKSHHHHQKGALRRAADRCSEGKSSVNVQIKSKMAEKGLMGRAPLMSFVHTFIWSTLRRSFHSETVKVDWFFHPVAEDNEPPCMTVLWKPGVYNQGENEMERWIQTSKQETLGGKRVVAPSHGENRIRQIPVDIFISQPRVDSGKLLAIEHTVKEAARSSRLLTSAADLAGAASKPHPPPPGTRDHFTRQSFPMCHFHCTARSDARCAGSDPPLVFIGFHLRNRAVHKRWLQMCLQLPRNRLCNDAPRRSDRVAKMWLPSSGWM